MRTLPRLLFLVILGLVIGLSFPAWPQAYIPCMPRDALVKELKRQFGEVVVAQGTSDGNLVEILMSPDGRTWTLIVTNPNTATCVFGAGQDWEAYSVKRSGQPS